MALAQKSDNKAYCIKVEPFMVIEMWDKCLPFLENPEIGQIEYTSPEELKRNCLDETYQLWILMEGDKLTGCFLTNIGVVSDEINIVNIFNLSGSGVRVWIKELDEKIVKFCQENGCKFYSYIGREGFAKLVPELKQTGVHYLREVPNV